MYIVDEIKNGFLHLVGVRQYHDTNILQISDSLLESTSGLLLQDAHPLLTIDNILSVSPDVENITYAAWTGTPKLYRQYERVSYNSVNYRALRDNTDKQPDISPDDWELFNEFNEWLENKIKSSIIRSVQKFLNEKKVIKTARSIYETKPLFNGAGSKTQLVTNGGNWVGFELAPIRSKSVKVIINRVGFQGTQAETLNLYLFHSSKKEYVLKTEIEITGSNSFEWNTLTDWVLPYIDVNNAGGSWYIVYNQNDLSGQAINTIRDWSQKPCNCTRSELNLYNLWSKYLTVSPMKTAFINEDIWDIEQNIYTHESNYGLNLELSVYCDYTKTLLDQKDLFKDLIYYGLAMDFMRELAYNPNTRINRHAKNTLPNADRIIYEIDGDSRGREGGLKKDFRLAMDSIKMDFEGLDSLCMPCRRIGIRYSST